MAFQRPELEEANPNSTSSMGQIGHPVRAQFMHPDLNPTNISIGKRRHTAEDKERADHTHKSPRVRKTVSVLISISRIHLPFASSLCSPFTADKRPHNHQGRGGLQTPRKSHSSREAQDSNQARIAQAGRQTRSSTKTIEAHRIVEQEAPQAERRFLRTPKNCKSDSSLGC